MQVLYWLPAIAWTVAVLVASFISGNNIPKVPTIPHFDKLAHLIMYLGLVFWWLWSFNKQFSEHFIRSFKWIILVAVTCWCFSIIIELMQEYIFTLRHFEWADILANGTGCILGIFLFKFVHND